MKYFCSWASIAARFIAKLGTETYDFLSCLSLLMIVFLKFWAIGSWLLLTSLLFTKLVIYSIFFTDYFISDKGDTTSVFLGLNNFYGNSNFVFFSYLINASLLDYTGTLTGYTVYYSTVIRAMLSSLVGKFNTGITTLFLPTT